MPPYVICSALQSEIETNDNLAEFIIKVNELHKYLIDISPGLSSHEKEKYGIDITNLVQQIADKERLKEQVKPKIFQFKGKERTSDDTRTPAGDVPVIEEEMLHNEITTGADIVLREPNCSFLDLSRCKVSSGPNPAPPTKAGSLTFHRIADTVINLQELPFQTGSIFISECQDSVVVFNVPTDGHLQVRLHNLRNCKLLISSQHPQTVIMEGCEKCCFHSSTQPNIVIRDFSNINLENDNTSTATSCQFLDFDLLNLDTAAIRERYIHD